MAVIVDNATLTFGARRFPCVVAQPNGFGPWPAVLLLHDHLGLSRHEGDTARRLAHEGYLVVAPDLYAHDKTWGAFTTADAADGLALLRVRDRALALASVAPERRSQVAAAASWLASRDLRALVADAVAGLASLKDRPDVLPRAVTVVGFGLGGRLAMRLAQRDRLAGAVSFYEGLAPRDHGRPLRVPLVLHLDGQTRAWVPAADRLEVHRYEGADGDFFNDTGLAYHALSARAAWRRTVAFLDEQTRGESELWGPRDLSDVAFAG